MPFAVTHILVPLLLAAIIRDFLLKKKKFSMHYVLIAGLGGILPDIDVAFFWILYFFGFTFEQVHKTFLHSIFIPVLFFIFYLALKNINIKAKICNIGRHELKLSIIFLMLAFGSFTHIALDGIFGESFQALYPASDKLVGINLVSYLPYELQGLALPSLDAFLLLIWIVYLEVRHRISDFI